MTTHSMLELPHLRRPVCPHCRNPIEPPPACRWIETGVGVLAMLALVLMLAPLGVMAWKACADFLSDTKAHSVLFQPLEDWTRY
jgi:hypothetical protein